MPVIACPGCGKKYNLPATAAGQVAKCACGKRFRVGAAQSSVVAAKAASAKSASSAAGPAPKVAPSAKATPSPKAVSSAKAAPSPKAAPAAVKRESKPAADRSDDFWDDTLGKGVSAELAPPPRANVASQSAAASDASRGAAPAKSDAPKKKKKKRKESSGVRWGFDWGKVAGGLVAFLVFGGITAAIAMSTGRIVIYTAGAAIVGLFTMLSGLMGEEGIW
jgi:hypothetical protein